MAYFPTRYIIFYQSLGALHHFLSIEVTRTRHRLILSQARYSRELLDRASMGECKPIATPMPTKGRSTSSTAPYCNPTHYWRLVGGPSRDQIFPIV